MKILLIIPALFLTMHAFAQGAKYVKLPNGSDLQIDYVSDTTYVEDPVTGERVVIITDAIKPIKLNKQPLLETYQLQQTLLTADGKDLRNYIKNATSSVLGNDTTFDDYVENIVINEQGTIIYYEYKSRYKGKYLPQVLQTGISNANVKYYKQAIPAPELNNTQAIALQKHKDIAAPKLELIMKDIKAMPAVVDGKKVAYLLML